MASKSAIVYGLVPGLATVPLTALRAYFEIEKPDSIATKAVSVFVLGLLWILVSAWLYLRSGEALKRYLGAAAIFAFVYRGAVGAVSALAWANKWTTVGGGPTRYETQIADMVKDGAPIGEGFFPAFAFCGLLPFAVHVLFALVAWTLVWAFGFRRARPFGSAVVARGGA
jgi:hypothetical protein